MFLLVNKSQKGFSILEFIVIFGMILTLSSIAFTSWNQSVRKSKTLEAKNHLAFLFQAQETFRFQCGHYYPGLDILEEHTTGAIPHGKLIYNIGGKQGDTDFTSTSITTRCNKAQYKCTGTANNDCKTDLSNICKTLSEFQADKTIPCYFDKNPVSISSYIDTLTPSAKSKIYPPSGTTPNRTVLDDDGNTESIPVRFDGYSITDTEFLLFAIGDLRGDILDGWVIDNNKGLTHFQQGY